jgi:hypothetical protein
LLSVGLDEVELFFCSDTFELFGSGGFSFGLFGFSFFLGFFAVAGFFFVALLVEV